MTVLKCTWMWQEFEDDSSGCERFDLTSRSITVTHFIQSQPSQAMNQCAPNPFFQHIWSSQTTCMCYQTLLTSFGGYSLIHFLSSCLLYLSWNEISCGATPDASNRSTPSKNTWKVNGEKEEKGKRERGAHEQASK